jgi:lipoprotein NlpD
VQERGGGLRHPESEQREVVAGDTLYSIAWESGRDYRELARWNGIPFPYVIKPGQKIRLHPPKIAPTARAGEDVHVVRPGDTLYRLATDAGVSPGELAAWNNLTPPYLLKPGQRLRTSPPPDVSKSSAVREDKPKAAGKAAEERVVPAPQPSAAPAARPAPPPKVAPATSVAAHRMTDWVWPTEGALLERFGSSKGVAVGGKKGQPIHAARDGRVVYQGSGLRGYGELIIVKHSAEFLSAYAHCSKTYVKEGDVVKRGQRIADMGSSGTDRVKLHFEIRYRGTPVDPLEHLPKK